MADCINIKHVHEVKHFYLNGLTIVTLYVCAFHIWLINNKVVLLLLLLIACEDRVAFVCDYNNREDSEFMSRPRDLLSSTEVHPHSHYW